jgi:hypothetical protein
MISLRSSRCLHHYIFVFLNAGVREQAAPSNREIISRTSNTLKGGQILGWSGFIDLRSCQKTRYSIYFTVDIVVSANTKYAEQD